MRLIGEIYLEWPAFMVPLLVEVGVMLPHPFGFALR